MPTHQPLCLLTCLLLSEVLWAVKDDLAPVGVQGEASVLTEKCYLSWSSWLMDGLLGLCTV